jgi:hypothetical protein
MQRSIAKAFQTAAGQRWIGLKDGSAGRPRGVAERKTNTVEKMSDALSWVCLRRYRDWALFVLGGGL